MLQALERLFETATRKKLRVVTRDDVGLDPIVARNATAGRGLVLQDAVLSFFETFNGAQFFSEFGAEIGLGGEWFGMAFSEAIEMHDTDCEANDEYFVPAELPAESDVRNLFPIFYDGFGGGLYCDATGTIGPAVFGYTVTDYPRGAFQDLSVALDCFRYALESFPSFSSEALVKGEERDAFYQYCRKVNPGMEYWQPEPRSAVR